MYGHIVDLSCPGMHSAYWLGRLLLAACTVKEVMIDLSLLRYSCIPAITVRGSSSPNCLAVYDDNFFLQLGLPKRFNSEDCKAEMERRSFMQKDVQ